MKEVLERRELMGEELQQSHELGTELSTVPVLGIGTVAAFIGGWALVCLASGIVASGGPVALVVDWVKAVIG